jgi:Mg-chelatase subunit ChlI
MFLIANIGCRVLLPVLQIDAVLEKTTVKRRRDALKAMPKALNDAFEITVERMKSQGPDSAEQAMNILKWIFLAERPLTVDELRHALAVGPKDKDMEWENIVDAKAVFEGCLGLIVLDDATSTLRLVHKSLQDYLQMQYDARLMFRDGHQEIAHICLTY